jgi:hypothetical protein
MALSACAAHAPESAIPDGYGGIGAGYYSAPLDDAFGFGVSWDESGFRDHHHELGRAMQDHLGGRMC